MGSGPPMGARLVQLFKEMNNPDWVWFGFALWAALIAFALGIYDGWALGREGGR